MGHEAVIAPMLSVRIAPPIVLGPAFAATVLTSRNAIPGCPAAIRAKPAFAVGTATATRAREAGFGTVFDAGADASALPGLIANTIGAGGQTLFLPAGRGQGGELSRELRRAGFRVIRRVTYDAEPAASLPAAAAGHLQAKHIDSVLFFSAETSRTFARLVQAAGLSDKLADAEAVSISERAAVPLRSLRWRRIRIAAKPNQDEMLVLLT